MNVDVTDEMEVLGLVVGALLVLAGLGTIVGQPWTQVTNMGVAVGELVGALMAMGIGALLVLLAVDRDLPF
jgi:hypothetical protein